jgi:peptidoglycan-N-acetylglucosamine deacetylase
METYHIQVIELLSLGKSSDGAHQMKVFITQNDTLGTYILDIDEFTFLEMEALKPLDGGRARLSLYPKWDPYRNAYYSSIVRTGGFPRETLYFACSEAYIEQIKQIRHNRLPAGNSDMRQQDREEEGGLIPPRNPLLPQLYARAPRMVNVLLVGFILLAVLLIPYQSQADPARVLDGQADSAQGAGTEPASKEPSTAAQALDGVKAPVTPQRFMSGAGIAGKEVPDPAAQVRRQIQPAKDQKNYVVIDLDEKKKLFGLPKSYVALTFDDGPSRFTQKIVDILTEHKVAATFLFIGENAQRNPEAVIYASDHGMSIGDHSWDHQQMTKVAPTDQGRNLSRTAELLESLTHKSVTLFRPPYGDINDELFATARQLHLKTLMWNRDPEDWNHKKPEDILQYFHGVASAGGIYVLHEDKNTVEALPAILDDLQGKNLKFAIFD